MKLKTILQLLIVLTLFLVTCYVGLSESVDEIYDGDKVYIDTAKAYISAEPHHINGAGWVEFELISKEFSGNIDVAFGFNSEETTPKNAYYYNPHLVNNTYSYTCDSPYWYNYTLSPKHLYCWENVTDNETNITTPHLIYDREFDSYNLDINTIYWEVEEMQDWHEVSSVFDKISHDYNEKDTWYYVKDFTVTAGESYKLKAYVDVPYCKIGQRDCGGTRKYDVAIKPSSLSISEAISQDRFYLLDPTYDFTSGLVSYFSFDQSDNLTDLAGSNDGNNTGAYHNLTEYKLGDGSYTFDSSGAIELANEGNFDFNRTDSFSVCMWAKIRGGGDEGMWGKSVDATRQGYYVWNNADPLIWFGINKDTTNRYARYKSTTTRTDTWAHYCFIYNGTGDENGMAIFRNGTRIDDSTSKLGTMDDMLNNELFKLGHARGMDDYTGEMDEVGIWSRAISDLEIVDLYNSHSGRNFNYIAGVFNPTVNLLLLPNGFLTTDNTPEMQFNFTDAVYENASCEVFFNNTGFGVNATTITNTNTPLTANGTVSDGNNTWYINCTQNNTVGQSASWSVLIDTIAPAISWNSPANASAFNQSDLFINLTASDANFRNISYYIYWSNGSLLNRTDYLTDTDTYNFTSLTTDQKYHVNITINDQANRSNQTSTRIFYLDATRPNASVTAPSGSVSTTTPTITYNVSDTLELSSCGYYVMRGASLEISNTTLTCTNTSATMSALSGEASYTVHVWGVDVAGYYYVSNSSFTYTAPTSGGSTGGGGGGSTKSTIILGEWELTPDSLNKVILDFWPYQYSEKEYEYIVKSNKAISQCFDETGELRCEVDVDDNAKATVYQKVKNDNSLLLYTDKILTFKAVDGETKYMDFKTTTMNWAYSIPILGNTKIPFFSVSPGENTSGGVSLLAILALLVVVLIVTKKIPLPSSKLK